jgi:hypothetical protein
VRLWFGPGRRNFFREEPAPNTWQTVYVINVPVDKVIIGAHFPETAESEATDEVLLARFELMATSFRDYTLIHGPPKGWHWLAYNGQFIAERSEAVEGAGN